MAKAMVRTCHTTYEVSVGSPYNFANEVENAASEGYFVECSMAENPAKRVRINAAKIESVEWVEQ